MANTLFQYFKQAKEEALKSTTTFDTSNDTYSFISNLFSHPHPKQAVFQGESAYIVLITRDKKLKLPVAQFPVATYISRKIPGTFSYETSDNFQYITKIILALRPLQITGNFDVFVSNQSYRYFDKEERITNRKAISAYKISCIGIDLDFYHVPKLQGIPYETIISSLITDHAELFKTLNIDIVRSGGGAQLYLHLSEPIIFSHWDEFGELKYNDDAKEKFFKISTGLNVLLSEYGSDTKCCADSARIYRPPGSCNQKNNDIIEVAYFLKSKKRYRTKIETAFSFLSAEIETKREDIDKKLNDYIKAKENDLGIIKEKPKKEQKKAAPPVKEEPPVCNQTATVDYTRIYELEELKKFKENFQETYATQGWTNLIVTRLDDMYSVIQQKNNNVKGYRNEIIFCFTTIVKSFLFDRDILTEKVLDFNAIFNSPLAESEVLDIIDNVFSRNQQLTNISIYNRLYAPMKIDISSLKGCYTAEAKRELEAVSHSKRNKKYHKKHYQKKQMNSKEQKIEIIKEHLNCTDSQIADMLSCGRSTVAKLRKSILHPEEKLKAKVNDKHINIFNIEEVPFV